MDPVFTTLGATIGLVLAIALVLLRMQPAYALMAGALVGGLAGGGGLAATMAHAVSGAQGMINMVIGVSSEYKCTGISIISHSETSGLGAVAAEQSEKGEAFRNQFIGVDETAALQKNGGDIVQISGATITSNAITTEVDLCITVAKTLG